MREWDQARRSGPDDIEALCREKAQRLLAAGPSHPLSREQEREIAVIVAAAEKTLLSK